MLIFVNKIDRLGARRALLDDIAAAEAGVVAMTPATGLASEPRASSLAIATPAAWRG